MNSEDTKPINIAGIPVDPTKIDFTPVLHTTSRKLLLEARARGDKRGYFPHQGARERVRRKGRSVALIEVDVAPSDVKKFVEQLGVEIDKGRPVKPHRSGGGKRA